MLEADSEGYLEVVAVKFDVLAGQCVGNAKAVVVVVMECVYRGILQLVLVCGIHIEEFVSIAEP